jgi:hypothetical protein
MVRPFTYLLLCSLLLITGVASHAQTGERYDFVPGEKVLFEDDFHTDNVSGFPSHWNISPCIEPQFRNTRGEWTIQKEEDDYVLRSGTTFMHISPVLRPFPKDSFTVEFDCVYEDPAACAELYFTPSDQSVPCKEVGFHVLSWGKMNVFYPDGTLKYSADNSGDFNYKDWHHFGLSYCNGTIKCYLDGHIALKIPDCGFVPAGLSIGCIAPVRFSHFTMTIIDKTNAVNDLLTKNKFITHAIHFSPGRSVIRPESMGVIWELVTFLEENPSINLRIDGHTDGDGNSTANMTLSEARAEEVKRHLIDRGISESRLTTKGFGPTKPIRPNTTLENKAQNRRVEFMRL